MLCHSIPVENLPAFNFGIRKSIREKRFHPFMSMTMDLKSPFYSPMKLMHEFGLPKEKISKSRYIRFRIKMGIKNTLG